EPDRVHELDRRLVAKQCRGKGRGAGQIAGGHDDRVRLFAAQPADDRGEMSGAPRAQRNATSRTVRGRNHQRVPAGPERAVESVEGDDAHGDLTRCGSAEAQGADESAEQGGESISVASLNANEWHASSAAHYRGTPFFALK